MSEGNSYKPIERFNLKENYDEFIRVHGFDIRMLTTGQVHSQVQDTRDVRDPQRLGEALLTRPSGIGVLEFADALNYGGT